MKFSNLFTEKDNCTLCPVRILAIAGAIEFLVVVGHNAWVAVSVDLTSLGTGLGVLLAAVSAAITAKAMTEKGKDQDGTT